ncbi:MAG: ATP-grasp domain-containing protein [Holophagales bacterium]|nr:MAG: ATP-grasp domain-containing protein [Holophagales bacterium]
MRHVVFVAPFFLDTTLRFVDAVADLADVRLSLVSQDPLEKLPDGLRSKLAAHWRIDDGLAAGQIAGAVEALARRHGPVERLLGALEQLQVPLGEVRDALGISGMGAETARNFRDKARMKEVLQAAGVPCARHARLRDEAEAWRFVGDVGYPVVLKPVAGAGAASTFRVASGDELRAALAANPPGAGREVVAEEFVVGDEHSLDTVSLAGTAVWHSISEYTPAPLTVVENPWIQWTVLLPREIDDPHFDAIRRIGSSALTALGMGTGLSHMEWFRRRDGSVVVSEVGARPPGAQIVSLISYAHDLDFYRAWARLMVDESFAPPERRFAAGAAYFRGQGSGRVRAVHGLDVAQRELGSLVVEAKLPQVGQVASPSYEGQGYAIFRHPETAVVRRALARVVQLVRVELG